MIQCKNCHHKVHDKYCSFCGQRAGVERISVPMLLKELPHAVFHVNKGIVYNFIQLFKRPGNAIYDYLSGKRRPFFHPASYIVISLVLNYLVVKIYDLHFYDNNELQSMDPLAAKAILEYDAMQWWFLEHTYIYILLAIPVSALFLFMVFKMAKINLNIAESATVVLFTIAQGVLIQTILYVCLGWVDSGPFLRIVETINMCILISYASMVIYQLIKKNGNKYLRLLSSIFSGFGLALIWLASAYLLLVVMK